MISYQEEYGIGAVMRIANGAGEVPFREVPVVQERHPRAP